MSTHHIDGLKWDVMNQILALSEEIRAEEGVTKTMARKDMERFELPYLKAKLVELKRMKSKPKSRLQTLVAALMSGAALYRAS